MTDYSLRIGTLNTQLDTWIFDLEAMASNVAAGLFLPAELPGRIARLSETRTAQAQVIAKQVLTSGFDYDVLALNEVFHEDARATLVSMLSPTFPYYVAKEPGGPSSLEAAALSALSAAAVSLLSFAPGRLDLEDSGLMLFSRFPITATDFHEFQIPGGGGPLRGFPDSFAAKGALYVELFNPRTGLPFSLVAAHLQEDKEEWRAIRAAELTQIRELLAAHLTEEDLSTRDVFVVGDLNILANLTAQTSGGLDIHPLAPAHADEPTPTPDGDEYARLFGPKAPPDAMLGLRDTWLWHTSAFDRGLTSERGTGNRLDLILHNDGGTRQRVPQHLTLAYNLCSPTGASYSDHLGVNAYLNHDTDFATPRSADVPATDGTWTPDHSIEYPAGMQWYRINDAGPYGFAAYSTAEMTNLPFKVYSATDLSRELNVFAGLSSQVPTTDQQLATSYKFDLPDPPYYVRVTGLHHDWVGKYQFRAVRQAGASKDEAVILQPFRETTVTVSTTSPINPEDRLWFVLTLDKADSGAPQQVDIRTGGAPGTSWSLDLRDADGLTSLTAALPDAEGQCFLSRSEIGGTVRYLVVPRNEAGAPTASFVSARWTSPLTILHGGTYPFSQPLLLRCDNETDPESGQDTILISAWVDGIPIMDNELIGSFEAGHPEPLGDHLPTPLRFLDEIVFRVIEKDSGDDDLSHLVALKTLDSTTIPNQVAQDDVLFDFDGGIYYLECNRSNYLH